MKERLLQQHQYMFNTTLEEWESLPTTQLSEWILKYKPVIKACLNAAQLQLKENSSDITGNSTHPRQQFQQPRAKQLDANPTSHEGNTNK
eukprot:scaffold131052_cov32-Attheya_sp.AAC.2